jgi:hypothetical protein
MDQLPKIAQQRLQATANPAVHPDPDLLTAFAEKSLNDRERAQVLQHLSQCSDCRTVVSLAMPETSASPASPQSSWLRWPALNWPTLRWGALAACAVVVGAAVTLHYEKQPEPPAQVAQKAPSPAPPANLTAENQSPGRFNEKSAAGNAPSSPPVSDQAVGAMAKSTSIGRNARAESAMSAPVVNSLNGTLQDQLGASVAKSKPAAPAASAAESAAATTKDDLKKQFPEAENKNLDQAAGSSNETVTVAAVPSTVETESGAAANGQLEKNARSMATAKMSQPVMIGRNASSLTASSNTSPSWRLSAEGALERSFDSGKTWQVVPVAENVVLRAFAANDSDIWAGGMGGALYHSTDAGQTWNQVKPVADGKTLTTNIVAVEFPDAQHGRLITSSRETWTTSDGGTSWRRN